MDAVEDTIHTVRQEWNVLKEKFAGGDVDPVFEGFIKEFLQFDDTLRVILKDVDTYMKGTNALCDGVQHLSETLVEGLSHLKEEREIASDCVKFKEAASQITRADAPHSSIAKLRRDMEYNIIVPIHRHLQKNKELKEMLTSRRNKQAEYRAAQKQFDDIVKKGFNERDSKYNQAKINLDHQRQLFSSVDKQVFEWLYILQEYRGDILDSTLQTIKYISWILIVKKIFILNVNFEKLNQD